ncbi:MAG: MBL fold metallo-hydrolase [Eubacteriales bacterium]
MIKINEKVYQFEKTAVSSIYFILDGDEATIVDTGMVGDLAKMKNQLKDFDLKIHQINNIIITHHHFDHTCNLKRIAQASGAKVYVHEGDYDEIADKVDEKNTVKLHDGDVVPILGGLETIHVKGHTDGTMSLYSKEYKMLIAGDCIFNNKTVALPPVQYNKDTDAFMENVKKLLKYDIEIILPGHGQYIDDKCNEIIKKLTK